MPYVVNVKTPSLIDCMPITRTRRAFATLEEVTIALPDGTVIEVQQTTWADLAENIRRRDYTGEDLGTRDRIINAFNAREVPA